MLHCRLPGPDVPPTRTWECMLYEFYEWNHAMLAPMRAVADADLTPALLQRRDMEWPPGALPGSRTVMVRWL